MLVVVGGGGNGGGGGDCGVAVVMVLTIKNVSILFIFTIVLFAHPRAEV